MARQSAVKEELSIGGETPKEEIIEETASVQEEPEKQVAPEQKPSARINTGEKSVKIRVADEVDCYIGGRHYVYAKDKEVSVPSDVAAILCASKKAFRL